MAELVRACPGLPAEARADIMAMVRQRRRVSMLLWRWVRIGKGFLLTQVVRAHAAALGIHRYVQAHTVDHPVAEAAAAARGAPEPFDGVAELWFDEDELLRLMQIDTGAEAARALLEDERRFLDLARSPVFFAEDYVVVG